MKTVTTVTIALILYFTMLVTGESFQLYLSDFETEFTSVTFYPDAQEGNSAQQMVKDIEHAGQKHNVEVFVAEKNTRSMLENEISIYGTGRVKELLKEQAGVEQRVYNSLLLGSSRIRFYDFDALGKNEKIREFEEYHLIGSTENSIAFKRDLIGKYAGSFPKEGFESDTKKELLFLQISGSLLLLIVFRYTLFSKRREIAVRIVLGESRWNLFLCTLGKNLLLFAGAAAASFLVLRNVTVVAFQKEQSIFLLVFTLFMIMIMHVSIIGINAGKWISRKSVSEKVLALNYCVKFITAVMMIAVLTAGIATIRSCLDYYEQKDFFYKNRDYAYIGMSYEILKKGGSLTAEEEAGLVNKRYNRAFSKYKPLELLLLDSNEEGGDSPEETLGRRMVVANRNAAAYLCSQIPEICQAEKESVYCFLPSTYKENRNLIQKMVNEHLQVRGFKGCDELAFYKQGEVIGVFEHRDQIDSRRIRDPVLILDNRIPEKKQSSAKFPETGLTAEYSRVLMYQSAEAVSADFEKQDAEYGIECTVTNIWENWCFHWKNKKRILYMMSVLCLLVLLLELFLIRAIVMMEYKVHAMELTVKKLLGYNGWQRYRKILLLACGSTLASILTAAATAQIWGTVNFENVIPAGSVVMCLELLMIDIYTVKLEKYRIPEILKGGFL